MDGSNRIRIRDEILELLYWLEGEKLGSDATLDGISRFLAFERDELRSAITSLIALGDVEERNGLLALTAIGHREAARRFADDFGPYLKQGHGECNDPACDCHTNPASAAACHARTASPEHVH